MLTHVPTVSAQRVQAPDESRRGRHPCSVARYPSCPSRISSAVPRVARPIASYDYSPCGEIRGVSRYSEGSPSDEYQQSFSYVVSHPRQCSVMSHHRATSARSSTGSSDCPLRSGRAMWMPLSSSRMCVADQVRVAEVGADGSYLRRSWCTHG